MDSLFASGYLCVRATIDHVYTQLLSLRVSSYIKQYLFSAHPSLSLNLIVFV